MEIRKEKKDSALSMAIEGRIDTTTAPQLETELKTDLDGVTELRLDFGPVEYISSAGLRVLLSAQKLMNRQGKMVLTHVSESVMEILKKLHEEGRTVILITHDPRIAGSARRLVRMQDGRILSEENSAELTE